MDTSLKRIVDNAKLGKDNVLHSFHETTNRNGEHLFDFLQSNNLIAANCHFQKPLRKLWTFKYPNKTRSQLDYILVRRKWIYSVKNCEAFSSTFNSVCSDHRPLTITVKLSLRAQRIQSAPSRAINFKSLTSSQDLKHKYAVDVTNRFSTLLQQQEEITIQSKYDSLINHVVKLVKNCSPKGQRRNGLT